MHYLCDTLYLRSHFRYDIKRQEWLRGRRVPSTRYDLGVMMGAAQMYMLWDFTFKHGLAAILTARHAGKDAHATMNEAIVAMFDAHTDLSVLAMGAMMTAKKLCSRVAENVDLSVLAMGAMMTGPHSDLHETAAVRLAGWVRTQISLLYPRLLAAMAEHADWPEDALLNLLPGAAVEAWSERAKDEPLQEFVNRVARLLEDEGRPKAYVPDPQSGKDTLRDREEPSSFIEKSQQPEVSPYEEFELLEETRALSAKASERVGLSPRELEVLQLVLQDYPEAKIAGELGIKAGTVKTLRWRIREKLGRAAGTPQK